MWCDEILEIHWRSLVDGIEHEEKDLELNLFAHRQPV